ncbi:hypothetical protein NM688_g9277 [Phlebia brevispora]|uniref:Uncharacterized protein n=1 Tax=Phlebia brevispora TaxID=194682 RepID=A0ACC1RKX9_9APHY|nr:hypothetical protein NM688_g9277 [Phlebia brevispora]
MLETPLALKLVFGFSEEYRGPRETLPARMDDSGEYRPRLFNLSSMLKMARVLRASASLGAASSSLSLKTPGDDVGLGEDEAGCAVLDYDLPGGDDAGKHTGANLASIFFTVLEEYGITHKVRPDMIARGAAYCTNTHIGWSNNDTKMKELQRLLAAKGVPFYHEQKFAFPISSTSLRSLEKDMDYGNDARVPSNYTVQPSPQASSTAPPADSTYQSAPTAAPLTPEQLEVEHRRHVDEEIAKYVADGTLADAELQDFDLCRYWQANRYKYPTLFRIALDVMSVQASAVPCERVISASKETLTARRTSIWRP